ncbi:hypothetical protein T484DRAFT_1909798 [Baffinella frigidus]|nr:hypothetical protein T484DRAFT_1909798 [Cryptophyta sp. CCMP2293]
MVAARHGAASVVGCDKAPGMAGVARQAVADNALSERVSILDTLSTCMEAGTHLPARADLLVSETFGDDPLSESFLPSLAHARAHLLTPTARVVPGALRVYFTLVDSPDLLAVNFPPDPPLKGEDGFDFSAWGALSRTRWSCFLKDHAVTLLTPPLEALRIDWSDPAAPVPLKGSSVVDAKVVNAGTVHAVVAWYLRP